MARKTPSTRSSNVTQTSGAHSITVSIPAGATWALIGIAYYNDTSKQDPTSVSLDSQAATLISSAGTASSFYSALYKVAGFSTGASKTLAYTVPATGLFFAMSIAVEYEDGTPTYGTNGAAANAGGDSTTAATGSLANSSGDLLLSVYSCADNHVTGSPTAGSGQSKLDETDDTTGHMFYGFTTETATGAGDVQQITGDLPSIAATVVAVAAAAGSTSILQYYLNMISRRSLGG